MNTLETDPVLPALLHEAASFAGCTGRMEIMAEESGWCLSMTTHTIPPKSQ